MKLPEFSVSASRRRPVFLAALFSLIAGCTAVTVKSPVALPALPPLVTVGAEHYTIRSTGSEVRFLVYRAGPLAAFGHNHVIRAATIRGDVYLNREFSRSGFAFTLPVKDFRVDEPAQRAMEGPDFAARPSEQAIAGTTHNMLGPALLDEAHYPVVSVRSVRISGSLANPAATVRITLHGVQRDLKVPLTLTESGSQLVASGKFQIKQSDFGIMPFSILGGGLQVADVVKIDFRIVAALD
jgi:YceI-like domain